MSPVALRKVEPVEIARHVMNASSLITVVDREGIQKGQATTNRIEDILSRTVPGCSPTNNSVRQIRGHTAQVLINGVPTNEALRASSGSDLNLLGADQLAGIEVARDGFGSPGGISALPTPRAESEGLTLRARVRTSLNPQHPGGSCRPSLYLSASQIVKAFDYHLGGLIAYDGSGGQGNRGKRRRHSLRAVTRGACGSPSTPGAYTYVPITLLTTRETPVSRGKVRRRRKEFPKRGRLLFWLSRSCGSSPFPV